MIIILTNGTEESRKKILTTLRCYVAFDLIDHPTFATQRHFVETTANAHSVKVVTRCFLKSQRYEIYCLAKRFKLSFCIIHDSVDNPDFEELGGKYDQPVVGDDSLEEVLTVGKIGKENKAHKFIRAPSGDYLMQIKNIMSRVGGEVANYWFKEELEKRIFCIISKNPIGVGEFEKWYRKMIENEMKSKELK